MKQEWYANKKLMVFSFLLLVSMTIGIACALLLLLQSDKVLYVLIIEGLALLFLGVMLLFAVIYIARLLRLGGCFFSIDDDGFLVFPFGFIRWSVVCRFFDRFCCYTFKAYEGSFCQIVLCRQAFVQAF